MAQLLTGLHTKLLMRVSVLLYFYNPYIKEPWLYELKSLGKLRIASNLLPLAIDAKKRILSENKRPLLYAATFKNSRS